MATNVYDDLPSPTVDNADTLPRTQASENIIPPWENPATLHTGETADTEVKETLLTASFFSVALVSNGQNARGAKNVLDGVGVAVCVLYGDTDILGATVFVGEKAAVLVTWVFDTDAVEL